MIKENIHKPVGILIVIFAVMTVPVFGQLTLENTGFEDQTIGAGGWTEGTATGWTVVNSAGAQHLTSGALDPPAQDGFNCCYLNQGGLIYQDITEGGSPLRVQANKTYKVSVWVGRRGGTEGTYGGILHVFLQNSSLSTIIDEANYDMDNPDQPRNSWTFQTFYLSTGSNPSGLNSTLQVGFENTSTRAPSNQFWFAQIDLDIISIESVNPIAINPTPANNSQISTKSITLQWQPGPFATEHDIYLSDSREDVVNATSSSPMGPENVYKAHQSDTSIVIDGLVPSTTYYWRIDEVGGNNIYKGDIWQFTVRPPTAYDPVPVDGAPFTDINVQLNWSPGTGAVNHHVYLGTSMEDVQAGTADTDMGIVDVSSFTPEPLEYERTYYWRIDEDDGTSIHTGEVWKFNTAPELPIIVPSLVGWWKLDEVEGIGALDSSGYGNHGTLFGGLTWVPGQKEGGLDIDGVDGSFVNCGNPDSLNVTAAITMSLWVNTVDAGDSQDDPIMTKGNSSYVLRHSADNNITFGIYDGSMYNASYPVTDQFNGSWHHLAGTYDGSNLNLYVDGELQATETHQGSIATNAFDVSIGSDTEQTWVWYNGAVDDVRIYNRALTTEEVTEVMTGDATIAANPKPGYGSTTDLVQAIPLTWSPGENAIQHDVYMGTDKLAVVNADTSTAQIYQGRYDSNSYTPAEIPAWNQTYYWRIDEVDADSNIAKGNLWLFTIPDYLIVDDFESYNDINPDLEGSKRIFFTWIDGYDNPSTNGSTMGYPDPIFADGEHFVETDIVHGGNQSAPVFYNNSTANYSEVIANTNDLPIGRDWTVGSPEILSLWVYGDPNNPTTEQMYLKVNDSKLSCDVDLIQANWQPCSIDLTDFNVDLSNVTTFSLGFEKTGTSGGSGMVFIDDIRLYLPPQQ